MMRVLMAAVLAAVEIGGAFGTASAEIESTSTTSMTVDMEVEVVGSVQAVVAHLSFDGETDITIPLLDRGGGTFGILTELESHNYLVVFEAIGEEGGLSDPVSLRDLGADFGGSDFVGSGGGDGDAFSDETRQAGWLALALVAASLSALAFWVFGARDKRSSSADEEE